MPTPTDMPSRVPLPGTSPDRTSSSTWIATWQPTPRASNAAIRSCRRRAPMAPCGGASASISAGLESASSGAIGRGRVVRPGRAAGAGLVSVSSTAAWSARAWRASAQRDSNGSHTPVSGLGPAAWAIVVEHRDDRGGLVGGQRTPTTAPHRHRDRGATGCAAPDGPRSHRRPCGAGADGPTPRSAPRCSRAGSAPGAHRSPPSRTAPPHRSAPTTSAPRPTPRAGTATRPAPWPPAPCAATSAATSHNARPATPPCPSPHRPPNHGPDRRPPPTWPARPASPPSHRSAAPPHRCARPATGPRTGWHPHPTPLPARRQPWATAPHVSDRPRPSHRPTDPRRHPCPDRRRDPSALTSSFDTPSRATQELGSTAVRLAEDRHPGPRRGSGISIPTNTRSQTCPPRSLPDPRPRDRSTKGVVLRRDALSCAALQRRVERRFA